MGEARLQRKLAAILAADIVGYSKLIRSDEEGTLARVKTLRREVIDPIVARFEGRLVKLMGDGILLEFSSVVDAVRTAVEVQLAVTDYNATLFEEEPITFRIGINLGDVVIDGDDLHGDGVNVAARLEKLSDPGGIFISDHVYEQIRDRTRFRFECLGEQTVKNIDRPIKVWRWLRESQASSVKPAANSEPLPLPDRPSIAVLPFVNMSADPEQEYFADGVAEDIITALSRIEWFFVVARNSSFTYKGAAVDIQQVGRELGVRYVLEGSVRRSGQRLRITAQLIDALSGVHVWAERYDRELSDIFDVQDEITRNVVASTQTQIQLTEGSLFQELEKPSLPVWVLINRSWKMMYELSAVSLPEAVRLAEEAVALDPSSGRAHQALASALFHWMWMGFANNRQERLPRAMRMAEHAVRLDKNNEYSHWTYGLLKLMDEDHKKAISELERAIEINPNCSLAYGTLGTVLNFAGDPQSAIGNNEIAIRSNPRDPSIFFRYSGLSLSHFLTEQYGPAVEWGRKSVNFKPDWFQGHAFLIASLVKSGNLTEAQTVVQDFLDQAPNASLKEIQKLPFRLPAHKEKLLEALRMAGLPE